MDSPNGDHAQAFSESLPAMSSFPDGSAEVSEAKKSKMGAGDKPRITQNGEMEFSISNHVTNDHQPKIKKENGERSHEGGEKKHKSSHGDKHKSSHGDKHRSSSSGDKHKSSSSSDKHRSHHSSSSSKDKHKSSSSDKHRSEHRSSHKSSHKEKHRDKDREGHSSSKHSSSSSSKEKSREGGGSSSSSKDKHRDDSKHSSSKDKDRSKSSSSSSKHKDGHSSRPKEGEKKEEKPVVTSPTRPSPLGSPLRVKVENLSPQKIEALSPTKVKMQPLSPFKVKREIDDDDDVPLSERMNHKVNQKRKAEDSDDDTPLAARMEHKKIKKEVKEEKPSKKRKKEDSGSKKVKKEGSASPTKKVKKEEPDTKWKWWEEDEKTDGRKWTHLEHKGPLLAPDYEPLPSDITFYYDGKPMKLTEDTEEVATFYGKMLDHDYTTKDVFNKNFFKDWRKVMTQEERHAITDLKKCNFREIDAYFKEQSEIRKNRSKEEKKKQKEDNEKLVEEYGFCVIDGHKQKIGNFRLEPPGLFRGRGEHPKQGMLKKRTRPEDIIINCSKNSPIPQPPKGHRWKEVRHDNQVTWLVSWTENVQGQNKYIMLNAASKLKGQKDWQKYEVARKLHQCADKIRAQYREDWKSKEMRIRQRAVAMYFIDKLALRAGNEKEEGETADTVGCCSLRVEHIKLNEKDGDDEYVVEFDFLGKDSIRYYNRVTVEKRVFKNLQLFMENKSEGDDLFDRLNTGVLNKHLQGLMDGLTAKVFRTYNASKTLQEQLNLLTEEDDQIPAKILSYNRANRAVAVLCNHQRAAPKNFDKQMENLQNKIEAKKDAIRAAKKEVKNAKVDLKAVQSQKNRTAYEKRKKAFARLQEQLTKLEVSATDKDENKEIALGTSKLNYLDPRISIAWCKKWEVPIEKVYNKTQREKFAWAIDMADEDFEF